MKKICVIGSLNTDGVATVQRFPLPGETITGKQFGTFPGGKGANQAVAAAKTGLSSSPEPTERSIVHILIFMPYQQ